MKYDTTKWRRLRSTDIIRAGDYVNLEEHIGTGVKENGLPFGVIPVQDWMIGSSVYCMALDMGFAFFRAKKQ